MSRPPSPPESRAPALWRWRNLAPIAFLTLAPKCVLCVLGYVVGGTALFSGGVELCGGRESSPALALGLLGAGAGSVIVLLRSRRK
ncbi:MAG: hypothetical protein HYV95_06410 [Opitutae bacterium]|nr:hypothetical protein [Opitutae bacterium]